MKNKRILSLLLMVCLTILLIPSTTINASSLGNLAFSVGTNYGLFDIDTSEDATTACDLYAIAGYSSYYTTYPDVDTMRGSFANGVPRIQSDILFFSGHGNKTCVSFRYNYGFGDYKTGVYYESDLDSTDTGYKYVGISGNMSTVKLATFAACGTAEDTINITYMAVLGGAKTAVGWDGDVNSSEHSKWLKRYNDQLALGNTVKQAVNYANQFTYNDDNVKKAVIEGNSTQVIKLSRSASVLDLEESELLAERTTIINTDEVVVCNGEVEVHKLEKLIKGLSDDFELGDYKVNIYNPCEGFYTVDFIRMIGYVESNSQYHVSIIDNRVVSVVDDTKDIDENDLETVKYSISNIESARTVSTYELARKITEESSLKTATTQDSRYFYDADTGELMQFVFTTYYFDGTDTRGKDMFTYKLS